MATRQFACAFLPATAVADSGSARWHGRSARRLLNILTAALGAPQAEDASTVLWGARDGTCLRLTCEHGAVRELELRVDLRERDSRLLRAVLDAAACLDLVIITETNHLIPSTRTAVLAAARCTSPGDAGM